MSFNAEDTSRPDKFTCTNKSSSCSELVEFEDHSTVTKGVFTRADIYDEDENVLIMDCSNQDDQDGPCTDNSTTQNIIDLADLLGANRENDTVLVKK